MTKAVDPKKPFPWLPLGLGLAITAGGLFFVANQGEKPEVGPKAKPPVPVTSAVVQQRAIPVQVTSVGNVEATTTVAVRSQVEGQLLQVHFTQGQLVRRGQILFSIDPRPAQAVVAQAQAAINKDRAAVAQARAVLIKDLAQLNTARTQLARYQKLMERGAVSQEQLDQVSTNVAALSATVQADQANIESALAIVKSDQANLTTAQIKLNYATIRSPLAGRVGDLNFYAGNLIRANDTTPLVTINQISPIYVTFNLPENQLGSLRRAMTQGALPVTAQPQGDPTKVKGSLSFVNNAVDPSTGTIKLKATFPNANNFLVPGQFVDTTLTLTTLKNALVIPSQAIQTGQQGRYVFVIGPDQKVQEQLVSSTLTYQGLAVIDQGLKPGAVVVTDGQLQLVPGAAVTQKKSS